MNICKCGCRKTCNKRFVQGHNGRGKHTNLGSHYKKIIFTEEQRNFWINICQCGCGQKCRQKFINGHNRSKIYKEKPIKFCGCGCKKECKNRFVSGHNGRGIPRSKETKLKIGARNLGHPVSFETRQSISKSHIGLSHFVSEEVKEKARQNAFIYKTSGHKDFPYICSKGVIVQMRSSWEVSYAKYLDSQGIEWLYEPKQFKLSDERTYWPDFYLPNLDEYHEVKGYMRKGVAEKINLFKKEYPDIHFKIIQGKEFVTLGIF